MASTSAIFGFGPSLPSGRVARIALVRCCMIRRASIRRSMKPCLQTGVTLGEVCHGLLPSPDTQSGSTVVIGVRTNTGISRVVFC
jgi:hypothetical protein